MNRTKCVPLLAGWTSASSEGAGCSAIFQKACNFQDFELFKMFNGEIGKLLGEPKLDPLKFGGNAFVRLALGYAPEAGECS